MNILNDILDDVEEEEMAAMINDLWNEPENQLVHAHSKQEENNGTEPVQKKRRIENRFTQFSYESDNFENYENEDDQNREDSDIDFDDDDDNDYDYKIEPGTEYVNPEDSAADLSSDDDYDRHHIHDIDSEPDYESSDNDDDE